MSLAQPITNGVQIAIKRPGVAIPEIEIAQGRLDDLYDVHFGINSATFDGVLDLTRPLESDLQGLGPRILDIKHRGGKTAGLLWSTGFVERAEEVGFRCRGLSLQTGPNGSSRAKTSSLLAPNASAAASSKMSAGKVKATKGALL
jgi:hypothetical protein